MCLSLHSLFNPLPENRGLTKESKSTLEFLKFFTPCKFVSETSPISLQCQFEILVSM